MRLNFLNLLSHLHSILQIPFWSFAFKSPSIQFYSTWLDKLFVGYNLMTYLRKEGFFVEGTEPTKFKVLDTLVKTKQMDKNLDIYK